MKSECITTNSGSKEWWWGDHLHREDGPAVERINGAKYWYINGFCHREDGPAVEWANGEKSWYIENRCLNLRESINDPELQAKYPKLIESMIIYLVHNS
jgi:hypothetical protein